MSSRLAVKASRAFEEKLDRILDDPEMLDRTPIRDFVLAYQVTLDQQRTALAACRTPVRTTRVTLEDARGAIEEAKRTKLVDLKTSKEVRVHCAGRLGPK